MKAIDTLLIGVARIASRDVMGIAIIIFTGHWGS